MKDWPIPRTTSDGTMVLLAELLSRWMFIRQPAAMTTNPSTMVARTLVHLMSFGVAKDMTN